MGAWTWVHGGKNESHECIEQHLIHVITFAGQSTGKPESKAAVMPAADCMLHESAMQGAGAHGVVPGIPSSSTSSSSSVSSMDTSLFAAMVHTLLQTRFSLWLRWVLLNNDNDNCYSGDL